MLNFTLASHFLGHSTGVRCSLKVAIAVWFSINLESSMACGLLSIKHVTDEQVFYDKFCLDKFYLLVCK